MMARRALDQVLAEDVREFHDYAAQWTAVGVLDDGFGAFDPGRLRPPGAH